MELEITGRTIEEAVDKASEELGAEKGTFTYEIVEYPNKGFFGIGSKPAVIRISYAAEESADLEGFLKGILEKMDVTGCDISISKTEDGISNIEINGEDASCFMRRQGDAIDGLQLLLTLFATKKSEDISKVTIDVNGYKQKAVKRLESLAVRVAKQVQKTHKRVTLNPMSAYQRRIIHSKLQNTESIQTYSVGSEPNRRVVISYVWPDGQKRPFEQKKKPVAEDEAKVADAAPVADETSEQE